MKSISSLEKANAEPAENINTDAAEKSEKKEHRVEKFFRRMGEQVCGVIMSMAKGADALATDSPRLELAKDGECLSEMMDDRYAENIDFLKQKCPDASLRKAYSLLMGDFPELRHIKLSNLNEKNAHFTRNFSDRNGKFLQGVFFNFGNPEVYVEKNEVNNPELAPLESVLVETGLRLGVNPSDLANNKLVSEVFCLAHEFGHALDFNRNFLRAVEFKQSKDPTQKRFLFNRAALKATVSRRRDMSQVLNASLSPGSGDDNGYVRNALRARFASRDIRNQAEYKAANYKDYRSVRSESIADAFATAFIIRHASEFIYDPKSGEPARGRVPIMGDESSYRIGEKIIPYLDFDAGKHVDVKVTELNGGRTFSGSKYLSSKLRMDDTLKITNSDDPYDENKKELSLGKVKQVRLLPTREKDGSVTPKYFLMTDRYSVEISIDPNSPEAPYRSSSPEELVDKYDIKDGDLVSLLKVHQYNYEDVSIGQFISGRYNARNFPISIGSRMLFFQDMRHDSRGGGTRSPIKRIVRKWKSFYAETDDGLYEILPYKDSGWQARQ